MEELNKKRICKIITKIMNDCNELGVNVSKMRLKCPLLNSIELSKFSFLIGSRNNTQLYLDEIPYISFEKRILGTSPNAYEFICCDNDLAFSYSNFASEILLTL